MRASRSRVATTIVVGLLVAACGSTPSPTPLTTSSPSSGPQASSSASAPPSPVLTPAPISTPTSLPAVSAWPYILADSEPAYGPDGTVYLLDRDAQGEYQQSLVALDAAGHVKPGWPIEEPPGSDFGLPAVGPDGSVYFEECAGPTVGCVLHRLDLTGRDLSGWPIEVPSDFACSAGSRCLPGALDFGPDGTTYVSHWREAGGLQVLAIDTTGKIKPGWPVAPDAEGVFWSNIQLGSDGTLFIFSEPDGSETPASIAAIGPDASLRPGWPVPVPGVSGYLLGPQGTVVVWSFIDLVGELCPSPRRTVFTVLGPDGRTLPGWPRGSKGYASSPVVGADGTVYYVSALGNVYAHERAGEIKAGWPVAVPGAFNACVTTGPYLAPDGTIYVLGDEVTARSPDGRSRPGWPYRPAGQLKWPCSPPGLDTDCVPQPAVPAFGPDGTVYLVVFQTDPDGAWLEVVALDRQGQVKAGWPYRLPIDPIAGEFAWLTVSPDGRLFVRGGDLLLALDPDGRVSD